jgi:hypothetical protein
MVLALAIAHVGERYSSRHDLRHANVIGVE